MYCSYARLARGHYVYPVSTSTPTAATKFCPKAPANSSLSATVAVGNREVRREGGGGARGKSLGVTQYQARAPGHWVNAY